MSAPWTPVAVGYVDVDDELVHLFDVAGCETARLLVRRRYEPLGFVTVPIEDGTVPFDTVRAAVDAQAFGAKDGCWPAEDAYPPITVVVCTRNRPEPLRSCLAGLRALDYPDFEIVVVDNASDDDATAMVVDAVTREDSSVRLVREPRAGLSRARNAGVVAAAHDLVAFTDDDVLVDPRWLRGIARGFTRAPHVGCVTGLVAAAQLATSAQWHFERRVSWSAMSEPLVVDLAARRPASPLFPYAVGRLGTGANMAFRRSTLLAVGGFDPALGAGTLSRGGEDLDAFVNVLLAGAAIAVEPAAVVWHRHRSDEDALRHQLYDYGLGLVAFLTKQVLVRGRALDMAARAPHALAHVATLTRRGQAASSDSGLGVGRTELRGMLAGPLAYARSRKAAVR